MHRIILSGIKHSGKSTVGWALSSHLEVYFADLDDLILRDSGKFESIRQLYRSLGKEGFQKQERDSLEHFFKANEGKSFVLSLGGGTIENKAAMDLMAREEIASYYLDADESDLYSRIVKGGIPPFLEGENPKDKFGELYKKRASLYLNWAENIIETRGKTPGEIASEIANSLLYT